MIKLDVGSGIYKGADGWTTIDVQPGADIQHDLRDPLPFDDASVDEIKAVHIIEHFYWWEFHKVLDDWRRVLKPGGVLTIEFSDLRTCADMYLNGANDDYKLRGKWGLFGNQQGAQNHWQVHKYVYEVEELTNLLIQHGFTSVRFTKEGIQHVVERDHRAICS